MKEPHTYLFFFFWKGPFIFSNINYEVNNQYISWSNIRKQECKKEPLLGWRVQVSCYITTQQFHTTSSLTIAFMELFYSIHSFSSLSIKLIFDPLSCLSRSFNEQNTTILDILWAYFVSSLLVGKLNLFSTSTIHIETKMYIQSSLLMVDHVYQRINSWLARLLVHFSHYHLLQSPPICHSHQ